MKTPILFRAYVVAVAGTLASITVLAEPDDLVKEADDPSKADWREAWVSSMSKNAAILLQLEKFAAEERENTSIELPATHQTIVSDLYRLSFLSWSVREDFEDRDRTKRRLPHDWIDGAILLKYDHSDDFKEDPLDLLNGDFWYITEKNFKAFYTSRRRYREMASDFHAWLTEQE